MFLIQALESKLKDTPVISNNFRCPGFEDLFQFCVNLVEYFEILSEMPHGHGILNSKIPNSDKIA